MRKNKNGRHRAALALAWAMDQTRRSHPHALGISGWQRGLHKPRAAHFHQTLPPRTGEAAR